MRDRAVAVLACVVGLLAWSGPACADAVMERYLRSGGFGGIGGFEGTTTTVTSPTAQRSESTLRLTGSFLGALQKMVGGGDSVRITRLDRDLVWTLDLEHKTYTEAPLTPKGERERRGPTSPPPRRDSKAEVSDIVITRNEFKVEKTGARKVVNGFACEEYLATWLVETLNQKTSETGKSVMTAHFWTTPETGPIRAARMEEQAYQKAYLQKLAFEMSPEEARNFGIGALAAATGLGETEQQRALARLGSELAKIQGYPIVTEVEWNAEGSEGTEARETPPARGGAAPGGGGDIGSALGRLFGGGQPAGGAATGRGARGPIFSVYSEVKSISVSPSDPTRFEVPAGYTKK